MSVTLGARAEHGFDQPLGLLSDCHRRIERFLAVLVRVVREFEGRALNAEAANAVQTAKRYFAEAAPRHTADEEESLFPRMRAAARARARSCEVIDRMESQHQEGGALHAQVDALLALWLNVQTLPEPISRELLALLERFQALYLAHIRVEDLEVFPLAAELLSAEEIAGVGLEMRARRGITDPGISDTH